MDGQRSNTRRDLDQLVSTLYSTLRSTAAREMGGNVERKSISPTDLVNECYLKLARAHAVGDLSRTEFVALACRVMRNVLVDRVRHQRAVKRGGRHGRVTLAGARMQTEEVDLLDLDLALQKLALLDERQSRVVELRFFGGLTHEEIGTLLDCSARTVNTEWALAKAWLHRELQRG